MNESKIPWPIWATVMLACAVVAAWASRPQTDDQRIENLQQEIHNLNAQLNHPQQPTYSPSVSEPSPSPTSTPTITNTEPTSTSTPTPETSSTPEPTLRLSDPNWDYSAFNSRKTYSQDEIQFILKSEPRYDESSKQVEWIVDKEINCFGGSEAPDGTKICFNFNLNPSETDFTAVFKDADGATIGTQNLYKDGKDSPINKQGNITTYRYRYILSIPDSVWSRWSMVSQVIIERI